MNDAQSLPQKLAEALRRDLEFHDSGDFVTIADRYDELLAEMLPFSDFHHPKIETAMDFWDHWGGAAQHGWKLSSLSPDDWRRLADHVIKSLENGTEFSEPELLGMFGPRSEKSMWKNLVKVFWRKSK